MFHLIMFFNQWIESVPPTCNSLSNAGWGIHSSVDFCNFVIHDIVKDTFWTVFSACSETWVMMVMVLLETQIWIWHPFEMWTCIEDVDFSLPSSLNLLRARADASEFDEGINRGCLFMLQYPACAMLFQGRFPTSMVHRLAGVCRWCLAKEAGWRLPVAVTNLCYVIDSLGKLSMLGQRPVPRVTTVLNPQAEMQVASTPHLFVTLCSTRYLSEGEVNLVHQQFLSWFCHCSMWYSQRQFWIYSEYESIWSRLKMTPLARWYVHFQCMVG